MAWRYDTSVSHTGPTPFKGNSFATNKNNATGIINTNGNGINMMFGGENSAPFAKAPAGISSAGAFLRSNAIPTFGGRHNGSREDKELLGHDNGSLFQDSEGHTMTAVSNNMVTSDAPLPFSRSQPETRSLGTAFIQKVMQRGDDGSFSVSGGREVRGHNSDERLPLRRLFGPSVSPSRGRNVDDKEEEYDGDVMTDGAKGTDIEFIRSARALFAEVDPELLSDRFVPYEHVLQIIAAEDGTEVGADEIDERLAPYYDLQTNLGVLLGRYIEMHDDEFSKTISGFSEMVLTVSGSDETLAQLKQRLIMAALSLDNRAEQLRVLRFRAAKALLMAESLKGLEASLSCEAEVRRLIDTHHCLAAVHVLRLHKARLETPEVVEIRATQMLRDYVNVTLDTLHTTVLDELMNCVFHKRIANEADTQMMDRMLLDGASKNVTDMTDAIAGHSDSVQSRRGNIADDGGMPLADILTNIYDDPCDDQVYKNYLRFIPLCVKTLQELGKLDCCYEAFFSTATRSIGQSVAHFLQLYGTWRRRREANLTSATESGDAAMVHATRLQGKENASPLTSHDEAAALIQQPELRAMLNALLVELEKIVRNTDYLINVVLVAYFPFLSTCLMGHGSFTPDSTCSEWDIVCTPLRKSDELREIVMAALAMMLSEYGEAERKAKEKTRDGGENATMVALKQLMLKLDIDHTLGTVGSKGCLRDVLEAIDAAAQEVQQESSVDGIAEEVMGCRRRLGGLVTSMVMQTFRREVKEMHAQWDMQVLSSQLSYYIEFVFHLLCDANEVEEDGGSGEVALKLFLKRRKGLGGRAQRVTEIMGGSGVDTFPTLDKMLSSNSPSGLLSVVEQTGRVSFSLVEAVKCVRRDLRRSSEAQTRRAGAGFEGALAATTSTGAGSRGKSSEVLVLKQAMALRRWFVLTPMNILTCYECTQRFYKRCSERAPRFADVPQKDLNEFFLNFLQTTYVPTLYTFHAQQLWWLLDDMLESNKFAEKSPEADDVSKPPIESFLNDRLPAEPLVHQQKTSHDGIRWSAVTVHRGSGEGYPVLTCVHYVSQVLQKVARICRTLSDELARNVQQHSAETLLAELTLFLKKKMQRITHGSLSYRILNADFEDAFLGRPSRRWRALGDENCLRKAHDDLDANLFLYYAYSNKQRTSGHRHSSSPGLDVLGGEMSELDRTGTMNRNSSAKKSGKHASNGGCREKTASSVVNIDPGIASMPASELSLKGDGVVVALAQLCHSTEWLCEIALETLAPKSWKQSDGTECLLPGSAFLRKYECWKQGAMETAKGADTSHWHLLGNILRQLCTLSQACLLHLSIEARFSAFQFIPQLRDESYNVVVPTHTADTFVQAYNQRITNFFALLRLHLSARKLKYVSITIPKPLSNLILVEIAHLRDKVISPAGLIRLQLNLLAMETTLQLVIPTDNDVREVTKHYFARPATFLRYLPNKDVTNDLVTSGDYQKFSMREMEELLRLVFRLEANEDIVTQQIQLLHAKIRCVNEAHSASTALADAKRKEGEERERRSRNEEQKGLASQPLSTQTTRHVDPNGLLNNSCSVASNDKSALPGVQLISLESEEEEEDEEDEEEDEEEEEEEGLVHS